MSERSDTVSAPVGPAPAELRDDAGPRTGQGFNPASEWFWPVINLVGLAAVVAINALANITEFNGLSTGEVVNQDPVFFQPAGFTFSIWSVIYALLAAFVVYTFLPIGRRDRRMRIVSLVFLVSNIANALWIVFWHWEQWSTSLLVMTVLLVSIVLIYYLLRRGRGIPAQPPTIERLMVWTPFSVYLGWVSVAMCSNIVVWSDRTGTAIWGMDGRWAAVTFLFVLVGATALMAIWLRDPTYAVVIVWATLGVAIQQWDRSTLVSIMAMVALLLAAALAVFGSLLAFEQRERRHVLPAASEPNRGRHHFWQRDRT